MDSLVLIAAISVCGSIVGSFLGILKKPSPRLMLEVLSFAAGVMLSIAFLNLIPESIRLSSLIFCASGLILGMILMHLIDTFIPHIHPSLHSESSIGIKRIGTLLFIGIFFHHFPEGLSIGIGGVSAMKVSLSIAIAIALHDIPEALCTAAPFYAITKSRFKAFFISSATAIPTLLGLLVSRLLSSVIPLSVMGLIIGMTAGFMIYISADELIPASCGNAKERSTIFSLAAGVILVLLLGLI